MLCVFIEKETQVLFCTFSVLGYFLFFEVLMYFVNYCSMCYNDNAVLCMVCTLLGAVNTHTIQYNFYPTLYNQLETWPFYPDSTCEMTHAHLL